MFGSKNQRLELVNSCQDYFWKQWCQEVTPDWVTQQKWMEDGRNLQVGDVVLVHEPGPLKRKYFLVKVGSVKKSDDGKVRSCTVRHAVFPKKSKLDCVHGRQWIQVTRSVQRLSLILPVEEQDGSVVVVDGEVRTGLEDGEIIYRDSQ